MTYVVVKRFRCKVQRKRYRVGNTYQDTEARCSYLVKRGYIAIGEIVDTVPDIPYPKTSIVVPVYDCLAFLKRCIASVRKFTSDYELIIVDNGSDQETREFIKSVGCKVVTNSTNTGFSNACNQGIVASDPASEYICFLNSDTYVTQGWLSRMIQVGEQRPDVGILGPSTCFSSGSQCDWSINRNIQDDQIEAVGRIHRQKLAIETEIFGFCYLVKREVIDAIGGFDAKRYKIGCTEEVDFNWRAGKYGYKMIWVKDSYVHHFGHKTFRSLKIDPHGTMAKNRQEFAKRKRLTDYYVNYNQEQLIPVLMITYNRLEYTRQAVDALLENTKYPFRLFIFDNGSAQDTVDYLKSINDSRVEVVFSEKNTGLAHPINVFVKQFGSYEYLAKADNDTIVPLGWLARLKSVLDVHRDIQAVQADHYLGLPWRLKDRQEFYDCLVPRNHHKDKLYIYNFVGGSGMVFRSSLQVELVEKKDSLDGWITFIGKKNVPCAFYSGVFTERLDMVADNIKAEPLDVGYEQRIWKMRGIEQFGEKPLPKALVRKISRSIIKPEVVIAVYEREDLTRKTIDSLRNTTDCRLIIVDNGSNEGLKQYLRRVADVLVENQRNLGAVKPVNQGIARCSGEFICISHNDVEYIETGWLDKIIDFMRENADVGVVALAGRKRLLRSGRYDNETLVTGLVNYNNAGNKEFEQVAVIDGFCYVLRNTGLRLDEAFGAMHYYDLDLSMQYKASGYKSYVYSMPCRHLAEAEDHKSDHSTRMLPGYLELVHTDGNQLANSMDVFQKKWRAHYPYEVR